MKDQLQDPSYKQLLQKIIHDVRSPVAVLKTAMDTMKRSSPQEAMPLVEKATERLEYILNLIQREMLALTSNIKCDVPQALQFVAQEFAKMGMPLTTHFQSCLARVDETTLIRLVSQALGKLRHDTTPTAMQCIVKEKFVLVTLESHRTQNETQDAPQQSLYTIEEELCALGGSLTLTHDDNMLFLTLSFPQA